MSKMTMPMAVFGGLALIAISLSLPTILHTTVISEAHAEIDNQDLFIPANKIAGAIYGLSACRN